MRLSLMKAAHAEVCGAPWQEIRVAHRFRPTYTPRQAPVLMPFGEVDPGEGLLGLAFAVIETYWM
jgi:hypothetical protein